jgi:hypothetical protein
MPCCRMMWGHIQRGPVASVSRAEAGTSEWEGRMWPALRQVCFWSVGCECHRDWGLSFCSLALDAFSSIEPRQNLFSDIFKIPLVDNKWCGQQIWDLYIWFLHYFRNLLLISTLSSLAISFCFLILLFGVFLVVLGFELGLALARQVLCHLNHVLNPFGFSYFLGSISHFLPKALGHLFFSLCIVAWTQGPVLVMQELSQLNFFASPFLHWLFLS